MPAATKPPLSPIAWIENYIDRTRETQWISDHGHEYAGEWVALDGDRLLAHGPDPKQVFAEARKSVKRPLFAHMEPADRLPEIGGFDGC
jgi:hypothetical protein